MSRRVVGFCGLARAGKDTAAIGLVEQHGYAVLKFAEPVVRGLLALNPSIDIGPFLPGKPGQSRFVPLLQAVQTYGFEDLKVYLPEVRALAQRYGTEAGRDIHGVDCWVRVADRKMANDLLESNIAITDVRFENESDFIAKDYGGAVIRIMRASEGLLGNEGNHASENIPFHDFTIANDGTRGQLQKAAVILVDQWFDGMIDSGELFSASEVCSAQ
jgi:hypothetical protein